MVQCSGHGRNIVSPLPITSFTHSITELLYIMTTRHPAGVAETSESLQKVEISHLQLDGN